VRVVLFLLGLFILGNLIVFLMPKAKQVSAVSYEQKAEISPESISVVAERLVYPQSKPSTSDIAVNKKCYRVGPFMHPSTLSLAEAKLDNLGVDYAMESRESTTAEVFRVYMGPYDDAVSASSARDELSAKGITDHFQRKESSGSFMVSLGIYSRGISAQRSLEGFLDKGIKVRMRPERTVLPESYWLNLDNVDKKNMRDSIRGLDWGERSAQFGYYRC